MKIRSLFKSPLSWASAAGTARRTRTLLLSLLVSVVALTLAACGHNLYQFPLYTFAGRPIPPSQLAQRVLVSVTLNGSTGSLTILDGLRDIRNNLSNTIPGFGISGFSGGYPSSIISFPEELRGYVYSAVSPYSVSIINYSSESSTGSAGTFTGPSSSLGITADASRFFSAEEQNGQLVIIDNTTGGAYSLNIPNVYRVAVNQGDTVALAMVRNSNAVYRIVKLNANSAPALGSVDCQPNILPVYCAVPVPGNFDRPTGASFSLDGSTAYVLNCGVECGGGSNGGAGISLIPQGALYMNLQPTTATPPSPVTNTVSVPGGVTTALSDSNNLYVAGQQLQPDGLFAGRLTTINLTTLAPSAPVAISDGTHTRLLFADDNTLWIGSQFCATGERAKQGLNYNCLTRYDLGTRVATIVPALSVATATTPVSVPYPNGDNNLLYYGSLTGICWVQNYHKVYTAYGGQVHAFNTLDGSEINNSQITVQGTALDVAYMDALTNTAN